MKHRNLGKFFITPELIDEDPEMLARLLFSQIVVVEAHFNYSMMAFEYTGVSKLFKEVPVGVVAPRYNIMFIRDGDNVALGPVTEYV